MVHTIALRELLQRVARGKVSPTGAAEEPVHPPYRLGEGVMVDTHYALRTGESEAVFCSARSPRQAAAAFAALAISGGSVLATRAEERHAKAPQGAVPTWAGFGRLAPLLGVLNPCAPGVAIVNIDNGFGSAVLPVRILRQRWEGT